MNRTNSNVQIVAPVSLVSFRKQLGISAPTAWRFRQREWLKTTNIGGRPYILPEHQAEFIRRAAAGEFARPISGACKASSDARRSAQRDTKRVEGGAQ